MLLESWRHIIVKAPNLKQGCRIFAVCLVYMYNKNNSNKIYIIVKQYNNNNNNKIVNTKLLCMVMSQNYIRIATYTYRSAITSYVHCSYKKNESIHTNEGICNLFSGVSLQ